ncbi:MAG: hypothetical protein LUH09_01635 [Clostridiales bacterium]|nr:hypothetical protein [Clostridiales bacterium]
MMRNPDKTKGKNGERGAIIVEATISLTVFMFAMFTLLSVIQIAYAQSRISVAVDCAAKEYAEYAHVYFATGLNDTFSGSGGKSSELFGKVSEFLEKIGSGLGSVDSELGQYATDAGTAMDSTSISDLVKSGLGQALIEQMMKKNLVGGTGDSADEFMSHYHISNLDLSESKLLEGSGNEIFVRAKYEIQVIKLLNIDFSFQMSTWAYTTAWSGQ